MALVAALATGGCRPAPQAAPTAPQTAPSTGRHGKTRIAPPPGTPDEPDAPRERPAAEPVHDLDGAMAALHTGQPEAAAAFLVGHLQSDPKDITVRRALARALIQHGAYDRAAAVLSDRTGAPTEPDILRDRAKLAIVRGNTTEAETHLRALLRAHPDDLDARGRLLTLLVQTGRAGDESRALMDGLYDAYDAGKVKTAADHLAVGRAALARGSTGAFKDANDVLDEAERLAPTKSGSALADEIALLRGDVFLEKYNAQDAAVSYNLILERDSWHPDALVGMARAQLSAMRFAPAARTATETLAVNPHHPDASAILARVALVEGRREEAERIVRDRVFAVNPAHPEAHAILAAIVLLRDDRDAYRELRDAALAHDRTGGDFYVSLAELLGFLHLYAETEEALRDAAERDPKNPYVQSARGLNLLRLGREREGIEAMRAAWRRDRYNERTDNVLRLYEDTIDSDYTELTRGDLTIRLPRRDVDILQDELFGAIERARTTLDRLYGMHAGPLRLEFYADPEQFAVRTVGVPRLGAVAVCFGDVITFIGPYTGRHNLHAVIWHELGHVYAVKRSRSRVPRWFTEGLSEWESEEADPAWEREAADLLVSARAAGRLYRLGELDLGFIRAESGKMMDIAYSISTYAVRYLGTTYGRPRLIAMLDAYGRGADTPEVFRTVLGQELTAVEEGFETWLRTSLDERIRGWVPSPSPGDDPRDELMKQAIEQASADDFEGAERTLRTLVDRGGDGYATRMALAQLRLDGSKPASARKDLEQAHRFNREALEPLRQLARLDAEAGHHDAEAAHWRAMMAIDSNDIRPVTGLLVLGIGTGRDEWRDEALARARAIVPTHPMVLGTRLLALPKRKRRAQAALLDRAVEDLERQGDGVAYAIVALAAEGLGRADLARKLARASAQDDSVPGPLAGRVAPLAGAGATTSRPAR